MQGEPFGRYRLLRRLAFGGMAEIFLAALHRDEGFEKRVVLKRILPQFSADPSFVQMFIDEAVVAARITHPNVVQVYDFGNVEGIYFIAMEHVDGADLRGILGAEGPRLGPAQVAAIGEGVARALSHAHNLCDDDGAPLNIVHRDVSPHNIMLSRAGEAKLMDFGIAKAEARVSKTATGTIKGKVAYMAPEQGAGKTVDKRSDQFALGLVLWECLSGERMFAGDSDLEVLQKVVRCEVRDIADVAEVPDALADVVMRCIAAEPDARYTDLSEVAESLAAFRYSLGAEGAVQLGELVVRVATSPEPGGGGRRTQALVDDQVGASSAGDPVAAGWDASIATAAATVSSTVAESGGATVSASVTPEAGPSPASAELSTAAPAGPPARRWLWPVLGAGGIAAVVAVLLWRGATPVNASIAQVEISSAPSGAQVLLEGRDTGLVTPAILPGQLRGQPLQVAVRLDGYEPWETQVTPSGAVERVAATLLRAELPSGVVQPSGETASPTVDSPAAEPAAEPPAAASAEASVEKSFKKKRRGKRSLARDQATGRLSLRSTGAWVDVYLRGRKLGTTPLTSVEVPAGKLRLRLVNRGAGIDQELELRVQPDGELRRTISLR